jgi:hypothetical protein
MTDDIETIELSAVEDLPGRVCDLLSRELACTREANFAEAERLGVEVDALIATIGQDPTNGPRFTEPQRRLVKRLHEELAMTLRAEQADIQAKLTQLRQVKRAVGAYRGRLRRP